MLVHVHEAQQGFVLEHNQIFSLSSKTYCKHIVLDDGALGVPGGPVFLLMHYGREGWMLCHACAGVLTKLDIMDKGTDASAMMRNQIVPLRPWLYWYGESQPDGHQHEAQHPGCGSCGGCIL